MLLNSKMFQILQYFNQVTMSFCQLTILFGVLIITVIVLLLKYGVNGELSHIKNMALTCTLFRDSRKIRLPLNAMIRKHYC